MGKEIKEKGKDDDEEKDGEESEEMGEYYEKTLDNESMARHIKEQQHEILLMNE